MSVHEGFDNAAEFYDLFESKASAMYTALLQLLDQYFRTNGVQSVLDMTCGSGAQAIPLAQKGYTVTASDISEPLLSIARHKGEGLGISFHTGDVRTSHFGAFDAVIAIYNSLGYLTRADFIKALANITRNLKPGGLFLFDSSNLDLMRAGNFYGQRAIDSAGELAGTKYVRFTQSEMDFDAGIMTIHWEAFVHERFGQPMKQFQGTWVRQLYTVEELTELLEVNGFKILKIHDRMGADFDKTRSPFMLVAAMYESKNVCS